MAAPTPKSLQTDQRMMIGRGQVSLVDDGEGGQMLQLEMLADEVLDGVERHQNYGVSSHPLPGAHAVTTALGGARGMSVAVVVSDVRYRIELQPGEAALHDDLGQKVHLTRTGIVIETTGDVTVQAGGALNLTATGDITVQTDGAASVTAAGDVTVETEGNATLTASEATITADKVTVDAPEVHLGGAGGLRVARLGDTTGGGVITGASTKVFAA